MQWPRGMCDESQAGLLEPSDRGGSQACGVMPPHPIPHSPKGKDPVEQYRVSKSMDSSLLTHGMDWKYGAVARASPQKEGAEKQPCPSKSWQPVGPYPH